MNLSTALLINNISPCSSPIHSSNCSSLLWSKYTTETSVVKINQQSPWSTCPSESNPLLRSSNIPPLLAFHDTCPKGCLLPYWRPLLVLSAGITFSPWPEDQPWPLWLYPLPCWLQWVMWFQIRLMRWQITHWSPLKFTITYLTPTWYFYLDISYTPETDTFLLFS